MPTWLQLHSRGLWRSTQWEFYSWEVTNWKWSCSVQVVLDDTIKHSDDPEKRNSNALEDKEEKKGNYNKGYKSDIEL